MYSIWWWSLAHYDYRAFVMGMETLYSRDILVGIDLSGPRAVTVSLSQPSSLVEADDAYVYLSAYRPYAFSHDFTRLYFLDFPSGSLLRLAPPFLWGDHWSYHEMFLRPGPPEMPYKVYLPLVIRQKP